GGRGQLRAAGRQQRLPVGLAREGGEGAVRRGTQAEGVPAGLSGLPLDDRPSVGEEPGDLVVVAGTELEAREHTYAGGHAVTVARLRAAVGPAAREPAPEPT